MLKNSCGFFVCICNKQIPNIVLRAEEQQEQSTQVRGWSRGQGLRQVARQGVHRPDARLRSQGQQAHLVQERLVKRPLSHSLSVSLILIVIRIVSPRSNCVNNNNKNTQIIELLNRNCINSIDNIQTPHVHTHTTKHAHIPLFTP